MSKYIQVAGLVSLMAVTGAAAQDAAPKPEAGPAPQQSTTAPPRAATASQQTTALPEIQVRARKKRAPRPAAGPAPAAPPVAPLDTQDARTGTVGVYANSTSVATKTNTPLINIPQSITVVTKEFIRDQSFQSVTDVTRYVPGVAVHQGEGNRDELVIRGVDSSANFFVNGFRDDVQYLPRSLQHPEHRGAEGAERADLRPRRRRRPAQPHAQGSRLPPDLRSDGADRLILPTGASTLDAGQAINQNFAARLNAMYEGSDTFRDYGHLERYGINPTVTWQPNDSDQGQAQLRIFSRRPHRRPRQSFAGPS